MVALFEVITKILVGSISPGMIKTNEDSPAYLFRPFNINSPRIDRLILRQLTEYDNYKVLYVFI